MTLTFVVFGRAQPAGSKRAFRHPHLGRTFVVDANPESRTWKETVQRRGEHARSLARFPVLQGPVWIVARFYRKRPASQFDRLGNVRSSAPRYPVARPDATKLWRGVEDALTGVLWRDDAQIVSQTVEKLWSPDGISEGVEVTVGDGVPIQRMGLTL